MNTTTFEKTISTREKLLIIFFKEFKNDEKAKQSNQKKLDRQLEKEQEAERHRMSEIFAEAGLANAKKMRELNAAAKEALEQATPTRSKATSPASKPSPQSATAEAIASFASTLLTIDNNNAAREALQHKEAQEWERWKYEMELKYRAQPPTASPAPERGVTDLLAQLMAQQQAQQQIQQQQQQQLAEMHHWMQSIQFLPHPQQPPMQQQPQQPKH